MNRAKPGESLMGLDGNSELRVAGIGTDAASIDPGPLRGRSLLSPGAAMNPVDESPSRSINSEMA